MITYSILLCVTEVFIFLRFCCMSYQDFLNFLCLSPLSVLYLHFFVFPIKRKALQFAKGKELDIFPALEERNIECYFIFKRKKPQLLLF